MHLTIGVMTVTWSRLLRDRIDDVASGTALAAAVRADDDDERAAAVAALTASLDAGDIRRGARVRRLAAPAADAAAAPRSTASSRTTTRSRSPRDRCSGSTNARDPRVASTRSSSATDGCASRPTATLLIAGVLRATAPFHVADLGGDLDLASRRVVLERLAVEGVVARA